MWTRIKMTSETCANCGFEEWRHPHYCKKFKPQNHSPQPSVSGTKKRETKSINEHLGFSENTEPKKNPHEVENPSGSDDASSLSDKIMKTFVDYMHLREDILYKKDVKEFVKKLQIWYDDEDDTRTFERFMKDEAGSALI